MARLIKVKKSKLIEKINENKENHKKDYIEAVEAYKKEAKKQLDEQSKALENGSLNISLRLISPIDKTDEYDKILSIFEWEVADFVELTQNEFNEYVLDLSTFSMNAKMLNSTYKG